MEGLELGWQNYFTAETSLKIMNTVLNGPFLLTLKKLDLSDCIWDDQQNCQALADIIANAPCLEDIGLTSHESDREIKIDRKAAIIALDGSVNTMGHVKILDSENDDVICQVETKTPQRIKI